MSVLGVLLAGGLSRRMGGGDKGLIPLGGKPVMAHAFDRLKAQTGNVIINANGDPNRFAGFAAPIVPDTIDGFAGPLAGVLAGLRYAQKLEQVPSFIVTAAADTPFFPDNLVAALKSKADDEQTVVLATSNDRRHPTFGLWPVMLADDLDTWLQDEKNRKVLLWVERHNWATADFKSIHLDDLTIDPFFNINTPEDFETAQELLKGTEQ
ncbi:MAG: molybdenum cofactor guanylyltransferase MobA [Hyphomicrobiales bacterium]